MLDRPVDQVGTDAERVRVVNRRQACCVIRRTVVRLPVIRLLQVQQLIRGRTLHGRGAAVGILSRREDRNHVLPFLDSSDLDPLAYTARDDPGPYDER